MLIVIYNMLYGFQIDKMLKIYKESSDFAKRH